MLLQSKNVLFNCVCVPQPPVAKKDPSAVTVAHMLKRTDSKPETHTNGSEIHSNIMNVSLQVKERKKKKGIHSVESMLVSQCEHLVKWTLLSLFTLCLLMEDEQKWFHYSIF